MSRNNGKLRVGTEVEIVDAVPRGVKFLEGFVTRLSPTVITVRTYKGTIARFSVKDHHVIHYSYPSYALVVRRKEK